jgi:transposase
MKLTAQQRKKILSLLPRQRGNVTIDNARFIDAVIYMTENACTWRSLPESFGPWHTVYMRFNRWAKNGVLERVFHALQSEQLAHTPVTAVSLDATSVKVPPGAAGALKKRRTGRRNIPGKPEYQHTPDGRR